MDAHLPVLQVVLPLMAAPVCAVVRGSRLAWALSMTVTWGALWIAIRLLSMVHAGGVMSYEIGGWEPPWGIEYRIDVLNAFVLVLVCGISAIVITYARASVEKEVAREKHSLFYAAYLLCLTGLLGITATGDAFNVFVFLEISSLSMYALIALGNDRRALTAAYRYLIMGTIGATFILIAIGLLYMMTGTLNMQDLSERIPAVAHTRTVQAAFAFLTVGVSVKLAVFPVHRWLPNAYTYAPSAMSAFLAATATKVALYVLLRFFFTIFGETFSFEIMRLDWILLALSMIAIVVASVIAIYNRNVKRLLAYSSVAQIGYMTLGIGIGTLTGVTAGILHMFNHALMKGGLFMALGCIVYKIGSARLDDMAGIGKRMPFTMAAFVVGGLSLIGVPLTAGFISKWVLIKATLEMGWWPVAALILFTSLLAVIYIWKVVEVAYFKDSDQPAVRDEAPLSLLIPTWVMIAANLYFGIDTSISVDTASRAAAALIGVPP